MSMNGAANFTVVLMAMTNLVLLGTARLTLGVRLVAAQGALAGVYMFVSNAGRLTVHVVALSVLIILAKGLVFPWVLQRTLEQAEARHEMDPYVPYSASILLGMAMLAASAWVGQQLPISGLSIPPSAVPISIWTMFTGLFLVVARRAALTQVLGYLVLENGIYVFGAAIAGEMPFLVEMGALLDVFVAVFVMGIAIFHISREFEHMDTDRLSVLRD